VPANGAEVKLPAPEAIAVDNMKELYLATTYRIEASGQATRHPGRTFGLEQC
jgi:hypothetical protein